MFDGVRVIEVAQWVFVPACGAVMADLGAEVIKIEHPARGDASRGLVIAGQSKGSVNLRVEQNNRGKKSVGVDLKQTEGRALLHRLVERADVFLTNFRADALQRLGLGVDALRARNPRLIYARGHGLGVRGPDAGRPGYDATAYWARGGFQHALSPPEAREPVRQRPALGDHTAAMNLAFGIAAALYRRERTGEAGVVDVSLLSTALWSLSSDVAAAQFEGYREHVTRDDMTNPLVNSYRTRDGRWLQLVLLEPDRYWVELCEHLDHPELASDPRFAEAGARAENVHACIALLDEIFATRSYAEWRERLAAFSGPWEPVQSIAEAHADPQTVANGYLFGVEAGDGTPFRLVGNPVQFDEVQATGRRAPEVGEHTEHVLIELGLSWDEIAAYKKAAVIT